jgi:formate hydrogenlyase transcriptional activator
MTNLPVNMPPIEEGTPMPLEGTIGGMAFMSGKPVFMSRPDPQMKLAEFDQRLIDAGIQSGGVVPLIAHERKLGFLGVGSFRVDAFSKSDQDLLCHIANQIAIAVENALAYEEIERLKNKLADEKLYLEEEIRTEGNFDEIIGDSPVLRHILKQIEKVAPTDSTILIRGETGTGKELIARAIHNLSTRRGRTLVKVNCAAIPMGLLESELFGHERGAFTGAISQRIGRFELAHTGTLFLDEVGDIPLELQPKLLRVLQEQQFERLGSTRTQQVDVRLVAATNCDLEKMVADKQYRSDLYYRLNVFPVTIPPLRERPQDIPLLVRFFAQRFARRMKKPIESISAKSSAALAQYHWPGNVRELENVIERAVILSQGPELEIPIQELKVASETSSSTPRKTEAVSTLESVERDHIVHVLEETKWVVSGPSGAAARLGMKRTTLQAKMRKLGISRR